MAFRGRCRGPGGGYGYGRRFLAKEEKYTLFPEINEFPNCNLKQKEEQLKALILWSNDLQKFWISSPYYYEGMDEDTEKNEDITQKPPLSDYMKMTDDYVPAEVGARNVRRRNKTAQWNPQSEH